MSAIRLLVADDDVAHRGALSQYLRLAGYEVVECADGAEALERLSQVPPDLVLLDVNMPKLDGFGVLERLRKMDRFAATPVLFLTAMGRRDARVRGLELGADDYVAKPYDRAELLARVRAALRRGARSHPQAAALSGDVQQLGLDAILQTLDLGRRRARVVLEQVGGELVLDGGVVIDCRFGRFSGHGALARLLCVAAGRFRVELLDGPNAMGSTAAPPSAPTSRGPPMSVQQAMMTAATDIDEARQTLAHVNQDAWVDVASGPPDDDGIERLRPLFPLTVRDLLLLMDGSLPENARRIARALTGGQLRVEPG